MDHFKRGNLIAFILKILGLVVIVWGIIQGSIILLEMSNEFVDVRPSVLAVYFTPIVVGFLIIGFGEIIDLFQKLVNQNEPTIEKPLLITTEEPVPTFGKVPFYAEQELKAYYSNKNMEIITITPTKKRDIFIVEVDGQTEYVEIGGFSPRILSEIDLEKYV